MKRKLLLALSAMLSTILFVITSCEKPEEDKTPIIKTTQTSIEVKNQGDDIIVEYTIENPVNGGEVIVSCDAEWIKDVFVEENRFIFSVDANLEKESRSSELEISYPSAESVIIMILQLGIDPENAPFKIILDDATAASLTVSVTPKDKSMPYVLLLTQKESFDALGSDENNFQDDMDYFLSLAEEEGMSLSDFLTAHILETGDTKGYKYEYLTPNTSYYAYAYGMSEGINRITEIVKLEIKTDEVVMTDRTFDIQEDIVNNTVDITITPSDQKARYFTSYISKQSMIELYEIDNIEEFAQRWFETEVAYYQIADGFPLDKAVEAVTVSGNFEIEYNLQAETDYYVFAASSTLEGFIDSKIAYIEFKTGKTPPSTNIIDITVVSQGSVSVDLGMSTTNDDQYGVKAFKASEIENMTNDELVAHIMDVRNFGLYNGDSRTILSGLEPGEEYYATAFGFDLDAYAITTKVWKIPFTTTTGENVTDANFAFAANNITSKGMEIDIDATPDNATYIWGIIDMSVDPSTIKSQVESDITNYIEWGLVTDRVDYMFGKYSKAHSGDISNFPIKNLLEETHYRVYAIGVSLETGEFVSDVFVSESYKTTATPLTDISIAVTYSKYFNGNELAEMYPDDCAGAAGYTAILPVKVEIGGTVTSVAHRYHIHTGDVTDTEEYNDGYIKNFLNSYGKTNMENQYAMFTGRDYTLIAYAQDAEGKHSPVFRQLINLTDEGTSPAEEYEIPAETNASSAPSKEMEDRKPMMRIIESSNQAQYSEGIFISKESLPTSEIKKISFNAATARHKR